MLLLRRPFGPVLLPVRRATFLATLRSSALHTLSLRLQGGGRGAAGPQGSPFAYPEDQGVAYTAFEAPVGSRAAVAPPGMLPELYM